MINEIKEDKKKYEHFFPKNELRIKDYSAMRQVLLSRIVLISQFTNIPLRKFYALFDEKTNPYNIIELTLTYTNHKRQNLKMIDIIYCKNNKQYMLYFKSKDFNYNNNFKEHKHLFKKFII